tara:strand:- start:567 stop:833 length:267 start_codon:yes stop_codon:yes gene_type:complete
MTYSELNKLSVDQLRTLNAMCVETMKTKRNVESLMNKGNIFVGGNVTVNHPKLRGQVGVVIKVNRTKAIVDTSTMGRVSIPLNLLTSV